MCWRARGVPVPIPAGAAAGPHKLYAKVPANGQQASTEITVVGATASLTPIIEVIDPSTNAVAPYASQGGSFTLRGAGFAAGTVTVTLGTASGQKLGTVPVKAKGTFKHDFPLPMSANGATTLVAREADGSQTLKATTSLTVIATPR